MLLFVARVDVHASLALVADKSRDLVPPHDVVADVGARVARDVAVHHGSIHALLA